MLSRLDYLLACVGEEASEVGQEVGKCLRFGLTNAYRNEPKNIQKLLKEFYQLVAVMDALTSELGVEVPDELAQKWMAQKLQGLKVTMAESVELGTLESQDSQPTNATVPRATPTTRIQVNPARRGLDFGEEDDA